jgi:hypothetical protein
MALTVHASPGTGARRASTRRGNPALVALSGLIIGAIAGGTLVGLPPATGWFVQPGTVLLTAGAALAIILGYASVASKPAPPESELELLDLRPASVRSSYEELAGDNIVLRQRDAVWAADNAALRERVAALSAHNAALERRARELEASLAETVGYLDTVRRRAARPLATRTPSPSAPAPRGAARRAPRLAAGSGARAALDVAAHAVQLALAPVARSLAAAREWAHEQWIALVRKALL